MEPALSPVTWLLVLTLPMTLQVSGLSGPLMASPCCQDWSSSLVPNDSLLKKIGFGNTKYHISALEIHRAHCILKAVKEEFCRKPKPCFIWHLCNGALSKTFNHRDPAFCFA